MVLRRDQSMSSCRTEHEESGGGGDDHSHHHHGHAHDHTHEPEDPNGISLWPYIHHDRVRGLGLSQPNMADKCFKPQAEKQSDEPHAESEEDDPEMILFIPFTEAVNINSICISGGQEGTHPSIVKLFVNRDDIDFSNASELPPAQKLELAEDFKAEIDYPLRRNKFQNVSSLTIFVSENFGGDHTRINYVGLKGKGLKLRHGVVETVYEARPQPSDHKTMNEFGSTMGPGV